MPLPTDLIAPKVAARLLGVHTSTVIRWIHAGKLKGYRISARYRVSKADVVAFVETIGEQREEPPQESYRGRRL